MRGQDELASITYVEFGGTAHRVEVADGLSVMEGAVDHGVPGIDAECGGNRACATCAVFVDEAWRARTGDPDEMEAGMLEFAKRTEPGARLSCQIAVTAALDGLVVRLPASQRA